MRKRYITLESRKCVICNKDFLPITITHIYCSKKCRIKMELKMRKKFPEEKKETQRAKCRKYYYTHKEQKRKRNRAWYQKTKEKLKFRRRKLSRATSLVYRGRKEKAGKLTIEIIQSIYEANIKQYGTLTCYLCLQPIKFGEDHIEHKLPLSRGGKNNKENLDISCRWCNYKKHNKTIKEFKSQEV